VAAEMAPVSLRALVGRINRKLKSQDQMMRKRGGWRAEAEHRGDPGFFVVDFMRNMVVADPEAWDRELGCLAPWERVVEEHGATIESVSGPTCPECGTTMLVVRPPRKGASLISRCPSPLCGRIIRG
jgi:hypothetical protein